MKKTAAMALLIGLTGSALAQTTTLRVFVGGQQRPDVMKEIFSKFEKQNPSIKVELEVGGATSDVQQNYLSTVLTSGDSSLDIFLLDIIRISQYAQQGWLEPLDSYIPKKNDLLKQYLPAYAKANQYNGKLYALPAFADAMFLYYRKDLLDKYKVAPPKTWEEMIAAAQKIVAAEKTPNLQGFSFQGAPIEGTVCTFLVPFIGKGTQIETANSKLEVNNIQGKSAMNFLNDLVRKHKVSPLNTAEIKTDDTRRLFQGGNYVFAQLWAYGWNRFQEDADTQVKGKVGVVPLPSFKSRKAVTCLGGWEWGVSRFSKNKNAAAQLLQYLSGTETSKYLALEASNLPVFPALYNDADILKKNPWFRDALPVVMSARQRPVHPRYPEISDAIRSQVNAVLAGVKTADAALNDMQNKLDGAMR